jgi:hypothetical protein
LQCGQVLLVDLRGPKLEKLSPGEYGTNAPRKLKKG